MEGLVIGLDLNDDYTQISCYDKEKTWTFPTVICRRKTEESWLIGEEAYASTLLGEGVMVDQLLKLAGKEGTATIGGVCYNGGGLLSLFVRMILEYPMKEYHAAQIDQLVITAQTVDGKLLEQLFSCGTDLGLPREQVHVISHTESFIYYVLSQKKDLWTNQVGLFELASNRLCYYELKVQRGMRRNLVQAESQNQEEAFDLDVLDTPSGCRLADQILCSCGEKLMGKKLFSTVFLTGKGFERQDWGPGFMKMICSRRRVFAESCLFARGAACKAQDYLHRETSYPYIFLCDGRLRTEISLQVLRRGREAQLVAATYGDCWYEAGSSLELIVDGQEEIELTVSYLESRRRKLVQIPLTGFPARPPRTTRVELKIDFKNENTMTVVLRDKGFGELFPASGAVVTEEVLL